ncbi:MAG: DUF1003 domain-containing protein [Ktedonobacteraceae bacterium]|nr:DUF1003 domain-containing protein [Ktedonobacteraceae bacterium]
MANSKNQPSREQDAATTQEKALSTLVDLIDQDIETLVSIRVRAEQEVDQHQRRIEKVTANLGRPRFLYFILSFVLLWIAANLILVRLGGSAFDFPQFSWLQGIISLSALLMTTVVLITQNRQGKIDDQRRHLDLTITLLTERKVSKLIELVEELRHDMPMVKDRHDQQAEMMKEMADPDAVLTSFNRAMGETASDAH